MKVSLGDLDSLFEQFFALVEVTVRLPPGTERRSAFRKISDYGARIDEIAVRLLEQEPDLFSLEASAGLGQQARLASARQST